MALGRNTFRIVLLGAAAAAAGLLGACRGQISDRPPIHLNPNMDEQARNDPQEPNLLFDNGAADRLPVPGTVARGDLREDPVFFTGLDGEGQYVWNSPRPLTPEVLRRGQERFNIYCAVCHDRTGSGKGLPVTGSTGMVPPPSFHDDRIRTMPDGQLFEIITHGVRTMPSYRHQVPEADRWAIIAYLRALQRSQQTGTADVPPDILSTLDRRP